MDILGSESALSPIKMQVNEDTIDQDDQSSDVSVKEGGVAIDDSHRHINDISQPPAYQPWPDEYLGADQSSKKINGQPRTHYSPAVVVAVLALVSFTVGNVISIQAHSYPIKAQDKGSKFNPYAFVLGIIELLLFIASPWLSKFMMTRNVKLLINAGILVTSTCSILYGLAAIGTNKTAFCILSFVVRVVQATGEFMYIVGTFSFLAKEISHQILLIIIGIGMATLFGIGVFTGEFIGPPMIKVGGYVAPFAVMGCILNFSVFTTLYLLPSPSTGGKWGEGQPNIAALVQIPAVFMSSTTLVSGACCFGFGFATFREHMELFQLDITRIGLIYAGNIIAIVIANPIWAFICQKLGKTRIPGVFAAVFIIVAFVLQGPAPLLPLHLTLPICIIAVILQAIGIGGEVVCSCMGSLNEARNHGYSDTTETKNLLFALGCTGYTIGIFVGSSVGVLMVITTGYRLASLFIVIQQALTAIANIGYACWTGRNEQIATHKEVEPLMGKSENE